VDGGTARIHEAHLRRAAREGLEPKRAGAAEGIEHNGVDEGGSPARAKMAMFQEVEERLARAVGRWADIAALRNQEPTSLNSTGDDAHGRASWRPRRQVRVGRAALSLGLPPPRPCRDGRAEMAHRRCG